MSADATLKPTGFPGHMRQSGVERCGRLERLWRKAVLDIVLINPSTANYFSKPLRFISVQHRPLTFANKCCDITTTLVAILSSSRRSLTKCALLQPRQAESSANSLGRPDLDNESIMHMITQ